jgi:hypothetical protein
MPVLLSVPPMPKVRNAKWSKPTCASGIQASTCEIATSAEGQSSQYGARKPESSAETRCSGYFLILDDDEAESDEEDEEELWALTAILR